MLSQLQLLVLSVLLLQLPSGIKGLTISWCRKLIIEACSFLRDKSATVLIHIKRGERTCMGIILLIAAIAILRSVQIIMEFIFKFQSFLFAVQFSYVVFDLYNGTDCVWIKLCCARGNGFCSFERRWG